MSLMKRPSAPSARVNRSKSRRGNPGRTVSAIALPMLAHALSGSRRRGFPSVARRWSPAPQGRCTATRGAAKRVCAVPRWLGQSCGRCPRCRLLPRVASRNPPVTRDGDGPAVTGARHGTCRKSRCRLDRLLSRRAPGHVVAEERYGPSVAPKFGAGLFSEKARVVRAPNAIFGTARPCDGTPGSCDPGL